MQTLYFIHPDARTHAVRVAAVAGGEPLAYGTAVEVSDKLAEQLLATGDWAKRKPRAGAGEKESDDE